MRLPTLFILLLLSCSAREQKQEDASGLYPPDEAIENFWQWFVDHKDQYENLTDADRDEKLNLILGQLSKVEDGLALEISNEFHGVRDIVISAEGDKSKFDIVKKIVSKAPKIDRWTVTAFRQRVNEDFTLVYDDIKFIPSKMYFEPIIDGDSLDVIVFADNISNHEYDQVAYYGLITLDNVLGEYDCVMKVRHYEFRDTKELPEKDNVKSLTQLPQFVDEFHKGKDKTR